MEKEEDAQEMNFLRSTFEIEPMGLSCWLFEGLELIVDGSGLQMKKEKVTYVGAAGVILC
jgi:hypothetical protein